MFNQSIPKKARQRSKIKLLWWMQKSDDGIINTIDEDAKDGFERLRKVLDRATSLQITDNPLVGSSNINDRKGICHHLANEKDEVRWTRK